MKLRNCLDIVFLLFALVLTEVMLWVFARDVDLLLLWMILAGIMIFITWFGEKMKRRNITLITSILLLLLFSEIIQWFDSNQFNWPYLWAVLEILLLIFIWNKYPILRKAVGEDNAPNRPRWLWFLNIIIILIIFLPMSVYFLTKNIDTGQFSVLAIAPVLGGLVLAAASIIKTSQKRSNLIRVAQKFISATILFIIFIPLMYMLSLLGDIDVNSFQWNDISAWFRGIYFWLAVPCFFIGEVLFLFGITDLILVLVDFDDAQTTEEK